MGLKANPFLFIRAIVMQLFYLLPPLFQPGRAIPPRVAQNHELTTRHVHTRVVSRDMLRICFRRRPCVHYSQFSARVRLLFHGHANRLKVKRQNATRTCMRSASHTRRCVTMQCDLFLAATRRVCKQYSNKYRCEWATLTCTAGQPRVVLCTVMTFCI